MENEIDFIYESEPCYVETSLSADEVLCTPCVYMHVNVDRGGGYVLSAFSLIR